MEELLSRKADFIKNEVSSNPLFSMWKLLCRKDNVIGIWRVIRMKKHFLLFLALLFLLSGCSEGKIKVDNPYEIANGTSKLSYYDTGDSIHMEGFKVEELTEYQWLELLDQNESFILVNEGKIRCIFIADEDVVTYRQISVGDDIDKVKKAFSQIKQLNDSYRVLFNEDKEEVPFGENEEDDWVCIRYRTDGTEITGIFITDVTYANELR